MREIVPKVSYTGVLNPNMRIFDVIMYTEYGTSYNSYIVEGSEKTALIDGSHATFAENFDDNIDEVLGKASIDYIVLNHTEPDHSGNLSKFVDAYPNVTILCSPAANVYLKNIMNRTDVNIQVVKDGDSISLGDKTLEFINAPFLHWPDTMFTYLPEDKILFPCDFLGAHFCEPRLYDYKIPEKYRDAYWEALEYYFTCIFKPFNPYVVSGLSKIADLDIEFACTSHGPILTKDGFLPKVLELYHEWSAPVKRENLLIPIFYSTAYGGTKRLAHKIQEGILNIFPDAEVEAYDIIKHDLEFQQELMNSSDAFLLGTLTINRDAVPPIYNLLSEMDAINMGKRPVALFGSFGWSGEAFANTTKRLESVKANVYPEQYKINFVPSEDELAGAVIFGENFAKSLGE